MKMGRDCGENIQVLNGEFSTVLYGSSVGISAALGDTNFAKKSKAQAPLNEKPALSMASTADLAATART
jgi:hypothetical protein